MINLSLQPLIYPTHTLLGSNVLGPAGYHQNSQAAANSLSPSTVAAHYAAAYDFANQFNTVGQPTNGQASLEQAAALANFQYGATGSAANTNGNSGGAQNNSNNLQSALAAAAAASNPNMVNYAAYLAAQQQAAILPSSLAAAAAAAAAAYQQ